MSPEQFNQYVRTFTPHLLRFAKRVGGNVLQPEDILQECFEVLWKNRDQVNPESIRSFLFTIAHRRIVDSYRRHRPGSYFVEELHDKAATDVFAASDDREQINTSLGMLPAQARELIVLRDLEGYSYEEIGDICQLTESQVKVYLFRARKKLKETILQLEAI
jgi:RNA polymerase sigma factor (sigma-70 family)